MHTFKTLDDFFEFINVCILEGRPLSFEERQDITYFFFSYKHSKVNFEKETK